VGILGAGPVTQAIHLPSLARLGHILTVRHIMDVDPSVAESVAARVGRNTQHQHRGAPRRPHRGNRGHLQPAPVPRQQVIAACRAGKKAVLCEKPFAMNAQEAAEISAVSEETGVPIIVGAMHTFDPGWLAAQENWDDLPETAHTIRSSIVLPPNARFEDFATEIITRPAGGAPDYTDPEVIKGALRGGIMGLAIHDLPLIRRFTPDFKDIEVLQARHVRPFGYVISLRTPTRTIELRAAMNNTWKPEWSFEAFSDDAALRIDFTPSYVQAGSATARIRTAAGTAVLGPFGHNGYEGEWRKLADIARGTGTAPDPETLIHDLEFALAIANAAAARVDAGLAAEASESGAAVVLDQRWAGNAVLAGPRANVQSVIADALGDAVLMDSVAVAAPGTDPLQLLTEQLSAVLHSDIELRNVRMVQRSANGYTVAAVLPGGAPVALQGILTSSLPATASICVLTSTGRADIVLPDPAAAWPAEVRVVTAEGATTLPTLYESAHRTSWSRVHSPAAASSA
jgi:myo-inositol 2-dehydrogenase/D-chiro-inositol 1-dehydrogenase